MAIAIFQKLGCVRSRPLLYLGLPCSGLLLLIPNVVRVFIFFSPLLLSTALLFTVLLNVPLDDNTERRSAERGSSSRGSELQKLDATNMIDSITEMLFGEYVHKVAYSHEEEGTSEISSMASESRDKLITEQIHEQSMNSDIEDVAEINPVKEINLPTAKHLITWELKIENGKQAHESFEKFIRRSGSACE